MGRIYAAKESEMSSRERAHQEKLRTLASQGMVLLENDGTLPISADGRNIALYGVGARHTIKGGTGSGDVNSRNTINVEEGLKRAGYQITTQAWLDEYDQTKEKAYESWGKCAAKEIRGGMEPLIYLMERTFQAPPSQPITSEDVENSDTETAVYVISRSSGEGADRHNKPGDYQLCGEEERDLLFLTENYAHIIVLLNIGGVMDTQFLRNTPGIGAVLLMSQAGNIGGDAVADVITGKVNPSGKLTDTWAKQYEDYPFSEEFGHNNGNVDDAYYREGIYVGYRYFDTFGIEPAYCFGYGKSYTTFEISTPVISGDEKIIILRMQVKNTGSCAGREVVQVYVSKPKGRLEKAYQDLVAFGKTGSIEPGGIWNLELSFSPESMASYSEEKAAWLLEAGAYIVHAGNSSRNTKIAGTIFLEEEVITEKVKNLFALDCPLEELTAEGATGLHQAEDESRQTKCGHTVRLSAGNFRQKDIIYQGTHTEYGAPDTAKVLTLEDVKKGRASLDDLTGQMTKEEMALLCVGKIREWFSAIGNACTTVPGAAGDTVDALMESRKIPSIILADGPAGLRLTKEFSVDAQGRVGEDSGFDLPGEMQEAMQGALHKPEIGEAAETYYQYCTAIPIATLLAQSWDMELIEECGAVVGREMNEFGVNLWLAPGMNIHRNPLCGRNFEYYSEDPLLSGLCAAVDTKGVQRYPGAGTTIKHFATNNQEDNRSFENNHVSERALREIYLKGFEICVKEAQPMSIMTSYNLLNGLHTANRYDLLTAAARDEWGFEGAIMTDWGTTGNMVMFNTKPKYPSSSAAMCIQAGNDLIMPGSKEDLEEILASVGAKDGEVFCPLTLGELQYCTKNMLKMIMRL